MVYGFGPRGPSSGCIITGNRALSDRIIDTSVVGRGGIERTLARGGRWFSM